MEIQRIQALIWDEWNLDHIQKHGMTVNEVEEVLDNRPVALETYKSRLLIIGPNKFGEMRAVVAGLVPGTMETYYVFSARPASRKERARYAFEMKEHMDEEEHD
jgi:uncharacterized DUF497 family protein